MVTESQRNLANDAEVSPLSLRHFWRAAMLAVIVVIPPSFLSAQRSHSAAPTLVLLDGKVFTADSTHPWAQAVAIRGERILAIGTTAEMRQLATARTRIIDVGGRVVIPGINDSHDHVGSGPFVGDFSTSASPTPDPAFAEVLDSIRAVAARTPAGTWIKTTIGLRTLDDSTARRAALDAVAPTHPVWLWSWWGHGAVGNWAALRALGIADFAADPLGGWYGRDASGRLTGRFDEYAEWNAYRRIYSMLPEAAIVSDLRAFGDSSLRMGITSVQDMAGNLNPSLTVRAFRDARLPIRIRVIRWSIPNKKGRNEIEWDSITTHPAPNVVVSGRKWVFDGSPIERNAFRHAAYPLGTSHGRLDFPIDTMRAILAEALRPGSAQLHMHIVGDSTADIVLALMHSLAPDSAWRARRVRFEHGGALTDSQVARVARLGIVIAQPRAGARLRTWHDAGIPLAYGSDGLRNPFYNLMAAVTGGPRPAEALSREEAVTMYTKGSAFAESAEKQKGTLAAGMLADIAVLSQDVFTAPAKALPVTTSVLTIVGGKVVWEDVARRP